MKKSFAVLALCLTVLVNTSHAQKQIIPGSLIQYTERFDATSYCQNIPVTVPVRASNATILVTASWSKDVTNALLGFYDNVEPNHEGACWQGAAKALVPLTLPLCYLDPVGNYTCVQQFIVYNEQPGDYKLWPFYNAIGDSYKYSFSAFVLDGGVGTIVQ